MAYAPSAVVPREFAFTQRPAHTSRGVFGRLLAAMKAARARQAEREIARYIADTGDKFTDEVEREIERRFLSPASRW